MEIRKEETCLHNKNITAFGVYFKITIILLLNRFLEATFEFLDGKKKHEIDEIEFRTYLQLNSYFIFALALISPIIRFHAAAPHPKEIQKMENLSETNVYMKYKSLNSKLFHP